MGRYQGICALEFFATEMDFSQERDRKARSKKASFTFSRDLRPKVGVSLVVQANVKVTAKRLDNYVDITNHERLFGSNQGVKVGRGQL